ncbi:MAG TPA: hypothetical protein VHR72_03040, partial [Gemmataceae bacterium]|nr:hypothetical protein [Gemmataceae bacterium]
MDRLSSHVLILLLGVCVLAPIRADDFIIDLKAGAAKHDKSATAKYPASDPKIQKRSVQMAGVDGSITVKWTVRSADQAPAVKDAVVHFFVVKEEAPDQQEVPKLNKNVVVESALTMDFKAKDKTEGEITFKAPQAGAYLLRLEIKGTGAKTE